MRPLYLLGGIISVGLGAIGAFLPLLPTVPLLLLATFCFARSNPEWERRILAHRQWGPQIADWRDRRAINRRAKIGAIGAMTTGVAFTWFTLGAPWVSVSLVILVICGSWIATRNE